MSYHHLCCSFTSYPSIQLQTTQRILCHKISDSMSAISIGPLCHSKHHPILANRSDSRMFTTVSCQNRDPHDPINMKAKKEIKLDRGLVFQKFFTDMQKFGKGMQDNLSPKKKGDWKDVTLMSLSFAVYVYMSQKIVCAYCAWISMVRQPW